MELKEGVPLILRPIHSALTLDKKAAAYILQLPEVVKRKLEPIDCTILNELSLVLSGKLAMRA